MAERKPLVMNAGQIEQLQAGDTLDPTVIDHGGLAGLGDDDHSQYHNDTRGDARYYTETELDTGQLDNRYFTKTEYISSSGGAGDAGKPIKLDAGGHIDVTMINDADIDHGSIGGLGDDDHTQYLRADGSRNLSGNLTVDASITIDGRDLSVDGTKLDGIEAGADVTDATNVAAAGAAMAGGAFHNGFSDFVANEHIDWTAASSAFSTTSTISLVADSVNLLIGAGGDFALYYDGTNAWIDPRLVGNGRIMIPGCATFILDAGDDIAIYFDGITNDFSTSGNDVGLIKSYREVDYVSGNLGTGAYCIDNRMTNKSSDCQITSNTSWNTIYNYLLNTATITNSTTSNLQHGQYSIQTRIVDTGTYDTDSTGRLYSVPHGIRSVVDSRPTFSDSGGSASGAALCYAYGIYSQVVNQPTLSSGSLTALSYGVYITISGNTAGTSTAYGIYIAQVAGCDSNYGVWDASGKNWILAGDNQKIRLGATQGDFDLFSDGTDAEIDASGDLFLNPSGNVKLGTHSAIGAETVTGYITIKDAAGNTRKLAVVS